jgi:[ribosomal protein S5]-alanine N-acetyltransferase
MMEKETSILHKIGVPTLTSERLELKKIEKEDAASIIDISVYDGFFAKEEEDVHQILKKIEIDMKNGESVHWGIFLKASNEIVGNCGFYRGYPKNVGEVGYVLKSAYRGLGIMSEAVGLVVDYGLHTMHLSNVIAYTDSSNEKSRAVLKRVGFHQVGMSSDTIKFAKLLV